MKKFGQSENTQTRNPAPYGPIHLNGVLSNDQIKEIEKIAEAVGFQPASVGSAGQGAVNSAVRRSNVAWLMPDKLPNEILSHFERVILDANNHHFQFDLTGFEAFQFTVYDESVSGEYKWHIDTMVMADESVRKLSLSILLSEQNEFEGGKLLLSPDGNVVVAEERKGRAVFFPSWVPHCVTPVYRGVRKSLVIWTHGPKFK